MLRSLNPALFRLPNAVQIFILCSLLTALLLTAAQAADRQTELKVGPMDCPACGVIVRQSLQSLDGVKRVSVGPSEERVRVEYDDGKVQPADMITLLISRGYNAVVRR